MSWTPPNEAQLRARPRSALIERVPPQEDDASAENDRRDARPPTDGPNDGERKRKAEDKDKDKASDEDKSKKHKTTDNTGEEDESKQNKTDNTGNGTSSS
ncbi:hypothetical protein Cob_v004974 [Colletotrichum orbiculare MAFF 240422]|uniref:Uncharacterized protein n=1 Tax=Colletotrichum orbiculare (strain 104-T / ATCC 96160 / CBS 514.97 / LARS 414 / MAFF 240422) TaxID=1213857 RepID=N4VQM9_COLOR|nr:hypothetical protein Cob_v004974 [Colletotrichum orbiculare MAFF 240422]